MISVSNHVVSVNHPISCYQLHPGTGESKLHVNGRTLTVELVIARQLGFVGVVNNTEK